MQIRDQSRRIRELEPLESAKAEAKAAKQEANMLREQLQQVSPFALARVLA